MASKRPGRQREDRLAAHWRRLGLLPGAPECVIKAAHRYWIEIHHPDRGGSLATAQQVNVARDEVLGRGVAANEHVAANYGGEPWHVLGVMANADRALVDRARRALASELESHPRLAKRVEWAAANFGRATNGTANRVPVAPLPPTPPRAAPRREKPRTPVTPGVPDGLVDRVDFGTAAWRSDITREIKLTWREYAPYKVDAEAQAPVVAIVKESKALPGRFVVSLSVDWQSPALSHDGSMRGYTLDVPLRLRWAGGGQAEVRVRGVLHYPANVAASPASLDLGTVKLDGHVRASLVLVSNAAAEVTIEPSAWLMRVDGAGRGLGGELLLAPNTPVRVAFDVLWAPIREKGAASIAAGTPVRPTGRIIVRWGERQLEVPVEMIVRD